MLEPTKNEVPSKCILTLGQLPKFSDPKQPSSKPKPFSSILEKPFVHSLDLVLPLALHNAVQSSISQALKTPEYALVTLSLLDILTGPFFTTYIKTGTIALQSTGRPGIDSIYSLYNGLLRLELPRDIYERAGLAGSPVRDGGRKHIKERFAVEFNLRLPSMVAGRKGFERLKRASEGVLTAPTQWLFADLNGSLHADDAPIKAFAPTMQVLSSRAVQTLVAVPPLNLRRATRGSYADALFEDEALELLEWVDLVKMESPRVQVGNKIDPFLSRFAIPGSEAGVIEGQEVVHLSWHGFIPTGWARDMLALWLNGARKTPSHWLAMSGQGFRTAAVDARLGWTVLRLPEQAGSSDDAVSSSAKDAVDTSNDHSDDRKTTSTKSFPKFVLYELTAGEHG